MDILSRYSLEGRVAVVTGAGRGIGQGIAEDFAKAGAKVILAARRTEEIKQVEKRIRNAGGTAIAVTADVTKSSDLDNLGSTAIKEYGKLTDWVNNAGGSPLRMPAKELPRDEWHKTIALNLTSIYEGCLTAERYMEKGSIINITSVVGHTGNLGQANYAASKAGIIGFTKSLAMEYAKKKININCVSPGFIETEMTKKISEEHRKFLIQKIPSGELGKPEDVANCVAFLASNLSNYITGETFHVNGGLYMA